MNRLYPKPLPQIRPVPEYRATGNLMQRYEEIKKAMQVPWMGVVTMAYAHYPSFFETLWDGAQPLVRSRPFVEASEALRQFTETEAAKLRSPPIAMRLENLGYAEREIAQIRGMIEIFSHGNFPTCCSPPSCACCWKAETWGTESMRHLSKDATRLTCRCRWC
jgi:hypothetical protein